MENVTNDINSHTGASTESTASETRPFDAVKSAFRKAGDDARKAAEEAVPRIKAAASEAAYWTAYGVTFAAVFQWTLVKGLAPESVKSGSSEGSKAGKDAAERFATTDPSKPESTALLNQGTEPGLA